MHLISNIPLIEPGQVRNFGGQTFAGGDGANFAHIAEKMTEAEIWIANLLVLAPPDFLISKDEHSKK